MWIILFSRPEAARQPLLLCGAGSRRRSARQGAEFEGSKGGAHSRFTVLTFFCVAIEGKRGNA